MREYLSHGMGVNSTALMLLLLDEGRKFESVFVDTGCEYPETYEYLEYLKNQGYEITVIKANEDGFSNLYDYLYHYRIIPSRTQRLCTSKFKVKPFYNYVKKPCIVYISYDFNERKRRYIQPQDGIQHLSPLIERHITRQMCKEIIKEHGLKVPPKSGCWLCPFHNISTWKKLRDRYPHLFLKAVELEKINPRGYTFLDGVSLSSLWQENKLDRYLGSGGL